MGWYERGEAIDETWRIASEQREKEGERDARHSVIFIARKQIFNQKVLVRKCVLVRDIRQLDSHHISHCYSSKDSRRPNEAMAAAASCWAIKKSCKLIYVVETKEKLAIAANRVPFLREERCALHRVCRADLRMKNHVATIALNKTNEVYRKVFHVQMSTWTWKSYATFSFGHCATTNSRGKRFPVNE